MTILAEIPYGAYWSTPFARWQGSLAHLHSVEFAAHVARADQAGQPGQAVERMPLRHRQTEHAMVEHGRVDVAPCQFGAPQLGGPTLMQACATGVRTLLAATQELCSGLAQCALVVTCDRTSNGPHLYYPDPRAPGGTGKSENWVMDNFGCDPLGGHSMLVTAENVASTHGIGTAAQHEVVLHREAQYAQALADDSAFLRRFMTLPFEVPAPGWRKTLSTLAGDEGNVDDQQRWRIGAQQRLVFGRCQPPVQRHEDRTQPRAGEQRGQHRGAVAAQPAHHFAGPDAARHQADRDLIDPACQRGIADVAAFEMQCRLVRRVPGVLCDPLRQVHAALSAVQASVTSSTTAIAVSPAAQPVNRPKPPPRRASSSISSITARVPIGA